MRIKISQKNLRNTDEENKKCHKNKNGRISETKTKKVIVIRKNKKGRISKIQRNKIMDLRKLKSGKNLRNTDEGKKQNIQS